MATADRLNETCLSIAAQLYYSNPFWSDSTDPLTDLEVRSAAEKLLSTGDVARRRLEKAVRRFLTFLAADLVAFLIWFRLPGGGSGQWPLGILSFLLLIASAGVGICGLAWYLSSFAAYAAAREVVAMASKHRYRKWLSAVRQSDSILHSQIVLWHQGQRRIALERAILDEQSEANQHLRSIRSQLD